MTKLKKHRTAQAVLVERFVRIGFMIHTNTLTCVYTINDKEAFAREHERIFENFKKSENEPWAITAISLWHEIHRLGLVEEAHEQNRHDLLDEIFGLVDPIKFESISALSGYAA